MRVCNNILYKILNFSPEIMFAGFYIVVSTSGQLLVAVEEKLIAAEIC